MPAATGMRFSIMSRCGGPSQPVASRKSCSARAARLGPSTPGQTTSSVSPVAGSSVSSSASESACTTETSGCRPSSRGSPTKRQRLTLPGARARRVTPWPRTTRAIAPARASPPARPRAGRSPPALRVPGRGPSPPAPASRGAPSSDARSRRTHQRAQLRVGRRAGAAQADEDGVDVRHRVEDVPRHGPQHAHLGRQLREHRRRAVGGAARLRGQPLPHLALHHRHLRLDARQLLDHAQDHRRRDAVGQVRDDLGRRRVERAEVEPDGVAEVQRRVRVRVQGVAEGGLELAVHFDHMHVRHACGQVLRQHAEPAADLEHYVRGIERRLAPDHVEQVRVDQEVLPEVAVGADPERLHAAQAGLRREAAHQPNRRAAFASTACSSSS